MERKKYFSKTNQKKRNRKMSLQSRSKKRFTKDVKPIIGQKVVLGSEEADWNNVAFQWINQQKAEGINRLSENPHKNIKVTFLDFFSDEKILTWKN